MGAVSAVDVRHACFPGLLLGPQHLQPHLTGSEYFPGGLGEFAVAQNGFLQFEIGPSGPVRLQWARYFDAADQAGQSRLWGGIHVEADDFTGRTRGHEIGIAAFDKAVTYFDGTAVP